MLLGCYVMSVKPCRRAKAQDSRWLSPRAASLPLKPQEEERERERKKKSNSHLLTRIVNALPPKGPTYWRIANKTGVSKPPLTSIIRSSLTERKDG